MENNKLKTNFLKTGINKIGDKLSKLVPPAVLAATLLNFSAFAKAPQKTTNVKATTPIYRDATRKYTTNDKALHDVYYSDLFKMNKYERLEADVRNDLVKLLAEMNAETLKLSAAYNAAEKNSIVNSNLSIEEVNKIAKDRTENAAVINGSIQHYTHLMLETLTLSRFRADAAEIMLLDENDHVNEFLRFNTKGERDVRNETEIVLAMAKSDAKQYVDYGKGGKSTKAVQIEKNLNKTKVMVTKSNQTKANYTNLLQVIDETATLLPADMFGTVEMRRGYVKEFAQQYSMNALLSHVEKLGYNVKDLKADEIISATKTNRTATKNSETKFNALELRADAFNTNTTIAVGADARTTWTNDFDLTYGGEVDAIINYQGDHAFQALGKIEPGYTFNNGHRLSVPLKAGINLDQNGVSTPFGLGVNYNIPLNKDFSLDFGASSLFNIQRNNVEIGGMVGVTYTTKKMKFKFGVGLGYATELTKGASVNNGTIIPDPDLPDNPNIKPKPPVNTEHVGDTTNSPILPCDPEKMH